MRIYAIEFEGYDRKQGWVANIMTRNVAARDLDGALKEAVRTFGKQLDTMKIRPRQARFLAETDEP